MGIPEYIFKKKRNNPIYARWNGIIQRCHNPNNNAYYNYGARGIEVCDQWRGENGYKNFVQDMYPTYIEGLTLERTNNNKGYSPENCVWATRKAQNVNQRRTRRILDPNDGKTYAVSQLAEKYGLPRSTINSRLNILGISETEFDQIVAPSMGLRGYKLLRDPITGEVMNSAQWAKKLGHRNKVYNNPKSLGLVRVT